MDQVLLDVSDLVKNYPAPHGLVDKIRKKERKIVRAVDHVSFQISSNETLGLVGESGSGKSTLAMTVMMLDPPTSGSIAFEGKEISKLKGDSLRRVRKKMKIVFQNPHSSLDPRQRVRDILLEPLIAFGESSKAEREQLVTKTLELVGLSRNSSSRFPHEFSGGQKQRIAIARALILDPNLIILDEPTSALDTSVQAQILNLLRQIQRERKVSYLFITHNVNVVKFMADRIAVMYAGKIVETGKTRNVLETPLHPYTRALIASVPSTNPNARLDNPPLRSDVLTYSQVGCRFSSRCQYAKPLCRSETPPLREVVKEHWALCHFAEEISYDSSQVAKTD